MNPLKMTDEDKKKILEKHKTAIKESSDKKKKMKEGLKTPKKDDEK